jgi:hypothetical protein
MKSYDILKVKNDWVRFMYNVIQYNIHKAVSFLTKDSVW